VNAISWGAALSLAKRELTRFIRQRNRVFGALAQPIIFWGMFGAGLGGSFRPGSGSSNYLEYFFPGTVVLILLFTAIFSTISIIEDRNEGFLQGVLVAPISAATIVIGKLLGTTVLATGQALLCLCLAPLGGVPVSVVGIALAIPVLILIAFALGGLGFIIAWKLDSTQGFHAVMTAFLMPMWFLSGAFFPSDGVPMWLSWTIALNPLTYGVAAFRHVLYIGHPSGVGDLPSLGLSLIILLAFAATTFAAALKVASHRSLGDTP
jgi:ABC-2 type transport system permease protein